MTSEWEKNLCHLLFFWYYFKAETGVRTCKKVRLCKAGVQLVGNEFI